MSLEGLHVYAILERLAVEAKSYLGIGVQEGNCVRHVVTANPRINLVLCDTWGPIDGGTNRGSHAHIDMMLAAIPHEGRVRYLDGPSQILIPKARLRPTDLAFVDGAHGEVDAYKDVCNVWPLVKRQMVVHDIFFPDVRKAIERWEKEQGVTKYVDSSDGTGTRVYFR